MANFPSYVNQNFFMGEGGSNNADVKRVQGIPETAEDGMVFCNEFYNTPLYREPNNGKVYKVVTSQYKAKNCLYVFSGDNNGLAYWVGTKFGELDWSVPSSTVGWYPSSSSSINDQDYNVISGNVYDLFNRSNGLVTTDNLPGSFFNVNLQYIGETERFYPTGVYLKSPNAETYGFIQNWDIDYQYVSGNVIKQSFLGDNRLTGINKDLYVPISNLINENFCQSFTITQTELNSIGTNHLCLGEIELYGVLK